MTDNIKHQNVSSIYIVQGNINPRLYNSCIKTIKKKLSSQMISMKHLCVISNDINERPVIKCLNNACIRFFHQPSAHF